jgi:hypothetical protein
VASAVLVLSYMRLIDYLGNWIGLFVYRLGLDQVLAPLLPLRFLFVFGSIVLSAIAVGVLIGWWVTREKKNETCGGGH